MAATRARYYYLIIFLIFLKTINVYLRPLIISYFLRVELRSGDYIKLIYLSVFLLTYLNIKLLITRFIYAINNARFSTKNPFFIYLILIIFFL